MNEQIADALTAHQRQNSSSCLCGWAELGKSHPAHQAAVLAPLIAAAQAEAWSEGAHFGGLYGMVFANDNPYRDETT